MKCTKKISSGIYKHVNRFNETWIIRGGSYWEEAGKKYWIANQANSIGECNDNNSACATFDTKKEVINFLNF